MNTGIILLVGFHFPKPFQLVSGTEARALRQDLIEELFTASGGVGPRPVRYVHAGTTQR